MSRVSAQPRMKRSKPVPLAGRGPMRMVGVVLLWLFVASIVALLLWLVLQAFRDTASILNDPLGWPRSWAWTNFADAWNSAGFGRGALNSLIVTAVASVATVALAAPAAYHLSRHESRLTSGITLYFVLGLGVPAQVILIPLFVMLAKVNLINSLGGLIVVYVGFGMPFTVFLLTAFFRSLPSELEEAASLDGCSQVGTFVRVMLPVASGGLVTALVLQIMANWNETLVALTLLQTTDKNTLPLALISFVTQQRYSGANWGGLFAGLVIVILPMLVVYLWLGRKLTEGLTLGSGK